MSRGKRGEKEGGKKIDDSTFSALDLLLPIYRREKGIKGGGRRKKKRKKRRG